MSLSSPQSESLYSSYRNPLTTRYASASMSQLFSEQKRAEIWRRLWIILAEEEKKLGLPIGDQQIDSMKKAEKDIDFKRIREIEKELRHDVMSHVKAFGEVAPEAEGIIHLGATSCYVTDNSDVLVLKEAVQLILSKLVSVVLALKGQIENHQGTIVSAYTHFQPAQPTTLGKRFCLWAQDLIWDFQELEWNLSRLLPLGCKGATGTQASFMLLFQDDVKAVKKLDEAICKRMGFDSSVPVSGQTLSRKVDTWFLNALSNLATSFSKLSYDIRLLQHTGELREPFGQKQIGSSAMAYKRNPMLSERMTSLSRFLICLPQNSSFTHASQWLERSLDDSANRRIVIAEAFLCADSLCEIALRLIPGLDVDEDRIQEVLSKNAELFATEEEIMRGTLAGGSRQEIHENIRKNTVLKESSGKSAKSEEVYSGAASLQAASFLSEVIDPFLKDVSSRHNPVSTVGSDSI